MGRRPRGGMHIEMVAAFNMEDIWRDSRTAGEMPNSL